MKKKVEIVFVVVQGLRWHLNAVMTIELLQRWGYLTLTDLDYSVKNLDYSGKDKKNVAAIASRDIFK